MLYSSQNTIIYIIGCSANSDDDTYAEAMRAGIYSTYAYIHTYMHTVHIYVIIYCVDKL